MNDVILFTNNVTIGSIQGINLVVIKLLVKMEEKCDIPVQPLMQSGDEENSNPKGYPVYSVIEDVFRKFWEENDANTEDFFRKRR